MKKLRLKSGITQAQLANKINVSPSCIGMYEQGRREPNKYILSKICKELNATGDYILGLEKNSFESVDVYKMLEEFAVYIESGQKITFKGTIVKEEEKKKISNALKIATAVALADIDKNNK